MAIVRRHAEDALTGVQHLVPVGRVGIQVCEDAPGYARIRIAPKPTEKLAGSPGGAWLEASIQTKYGLVSSKWTKTDGGWRFDITTPVEAEIVLPSGVRKVPAGSYVLHEMKA